MIGEQWAGKGPALSLLCHLPGVASGAPGGQTAQGAGPAACKAWPDLGQASAR